jgi:hypothetical protein
MDDEFIDAIDKIADTSFDASAPPAKPAPLAKPECAKRPSGSTTAGFLKGERKGERIPFEVMPTQCPPWPGKPDGRAGTLLEKQGAWQLQTEYLEDRLGTDKEENGQLWNTVKWINKHYAVTRTPAEAMPSINIYVPDPISQSTGGAPTGEDDEAPDPKDNNPGIRVTDINFVAKDKLERPIVIGYDKKGSKRIYALDINASGYDLLRLVDELNEIDKLAAFDIKDLVSEAPPLLPQNDFPSAEQRAESCKIILILMTQMRTLWQPVISAIADHATMKSLGEGRGKDTVAAVGRQRLIEGLRLAESIRRELRRKERAFSMWQAQVRAGHEQVGASEWRRANRYKVPSVDDTIKGTLAVLADNVYANQTGPVFKRTDKPLHDNDNYRAADAVSEAA